MNTAMARQRVSAAGARERASSPEPCARSCERWRSSRRRPRRQGRLRWHRLRVLRAASSIWSSRRRVRSALSPYCSRFSLAICSLRWAISASRALSRARALASRASASLAREMAAAASAFSASRSLGRAEMAVTTKLSESPHTPSCKGKMQGRTVYPALWGRQLYCGLRQSMPSRRQASCEAVSATIPSVADGQMKRPFSSLLA